MKPKRPDEQSTHKRQEEPAQPAGQKSTSRYPHSLSKRLGITVAVLYTLAVLGVALVTGSWLYDWSRLRILGDAMMSEQVYLDLLSLDLFDAKVDAKPGPGAGEEQAADPQPEIAPDDTAVSVPPINVLLLGTDARPGEEGAPRTDTMLLLTFDPQDQTVGMLSLPRDLWVPIPGFGYDTKINMAYAIGERENYTGGGPQLAKDTVSSFIGQPVQYYAHVNFQGFVEIVELIGGVDVAVPSTIHDEEYPTDDYEVTTFHLDAGIQHLSGETALRYVRTRNTDDDYARASRQQQVIRAMVDKVTRADMLPTMLAKLPRLLGAMRSSVETDIPLALQLEMANYFSSSAPEKLQIRQLVLDSRYGEETYSEEGAWILLPDRGRVRAALDEFFAPPPAGDSAVAMQDSSGVRIEILNGTGEQGVAARTREILQSQGWQVVLIGDADRGDYGRTLIINYGVPDALVNQVGADLGLSPTTSSLHGLDASMPIDVRIVVGRDFLSHLPQYQ